MIPVRIAAVAAASLLVAGCASVPTGPGVMVLPGTGKSFDQFRGDDMECRQFASSQIGGDSPDNAGDSSGVKSAAVGTAIGAAAGALIGGRSGAAAGAGTGLIIGGASGAGAAGSSQRTLQQRYDIGYQQCMYAKGHQVPMAANSVPRRAAPAAYTPPPPPPPAYSSAPPPPPPGTPPPPPPGVK